MNCIAVNKKCNEKCNSPIKSKKSTLYGFFFAICPFFGWSQHWQDVGGSSSMFGLICNYMAVDSAHHDLYVNGPIYYTNGSLHLNRIARWDGTSYHPVGCPDGEDLSGCGQVGGFNFIDTAIYLGATSSQAFNCFPNDPIGTSPIYFDGLQWKAFDPVNDIWVPSFYGFAKYQNEIVVFGDGPIDMPNPFTGINDTFNNISAWDGTWWHPLGQGNNAGARYDVMGSPYTGVIYSAVEYQGELFVGGIFTHAGGVIWPSGSVSRWNGSSWNGCGNTSIDNVKLFVVNGELYAGIYGGLFIYQWDGNQFNLIGQAPWSIAGNSISTMTGYGNKLIVGGTFNSINGVAARNIAMFDGQQWSAIDSGLYNINGASEVTDLKVLDGWLYATGNFTNAGDQQTLVNTFARIGLASGLEENPLTNHQFELSPNPACTSINIKLTQNKKNKLLHIYIYDIFGKLLHLQSFDGSANVDISNLNNGIYILKVLDKNGYVSSKPFIIAR